MRNIVWYNQSGDITYLMVSYDEQKMPSHIKKLVNKAYKGYTISWVSEVHHDGNIIYVVNLENESNIKQITVCDGEMNVYREYKKAL